jgi:hypothetical protein
MARCLETKERRPALSKGRQLKLLLREQSSEFVGVS